MQDKGRLKTKVQVFRRPFLSLLNKKNNVTIKTPNKTKLLFK
ncbi:hypothetical protein MCC93_24070 [Morococcus cerebrosus]|uniref:Uncharacterized protein n=1 Tax=Morococcus cerebrosus TaxID=1056807 RepID=A0A0C1EBC7_9NEIS|nr:hypothetical protein MCC93_24070 [Morococcus cerebrosus]